MKYFNDFLEAGKYALQHNLPLWDTHGILHRYAVGNPTMEMEDDDDLDDWEEIPQDVIQTELEMYE